jgi:ribonuclease HI
MHIYTDGGCINNGQPDAWGAWAFVVVETGFKSFGPLCNTTNNRAELTAIICAVEHARSQGHFSVTVYTDSDLCVKCGTGRWKRKKNLDLWRQYADAINGMHVHLIWVRGHNGNQHNERADDLCSVEMQRMEDFSEHLDKRA